MTCKEFGQGLPEFLEQGGKELQAHMEQCGACSEVVADLRAISQKARTLQDMDEPSPRVWNSLEIALRQEGLIRPQPLPATSRVSIPSLVRGWGRAAWLVPAAAVVLVGVFFLRNPSHVGDSTANNQSGPRVIKVTNAPIPVNDDVMSDDDQQVLSAVEQRSPMMMAAYRTNLRNVNAYIHDAEATVNAYPNDEEARRSLMDAYEQKSMLYDLALDHSLQ
jgi:hypothetical protein